MTTAILMALVLRLDAPAFRAREAAHIALKKLGARADDALEWGMRACALEGQRRCRALLGGRLWARAFRRSAAYPTPWIDARIDRSENAWTAPVVPDFEHYLALARACGFRDNWPDYPAYRMATRLWVTSQLVQERPDAEIRATLGRMQADEEAWSQRWRRGREE